MRAVTSALADGMISLGEAATSREYTCLFGNFVIVVITIKRPLLAVSFSPRWQRHRRRWIWVARSEAGATREYGSVSGAFRYITRGVIGGPRQNARES